MKIAIINHNLGSGGAEKLIYDMAIELKEKNIDFSIILLTNIEDVYGKKLLKMGIDVRYLSNKKDVYSPKNIYRLKKVLKNYNIIHTHTYSSQLWTAFVSILLPKDKKYILTEHSTSNRRRSKNYFRYLDRWMYSRYSTIISITDKVQEELQNWIKIKLNYKVISNGIDIEKYLSAKKRNRAEFGLNDDDKLICQIARFTPLKKHEVTIEALKLLPQNYKVIFLGEGITREKIQNLVKQHELLERVKFLGYRDDIPEIIKMCDISILTSEYEGLPISAIESMCLHPFIGSNVSGISDLVQGCEEMLFEYKNSSDLVKKIKKVIENKEIYLRLKKKSYERAVNFNIKNTVKKYLEEYLSLDKN